MPLSQKKLAGIQLVCMSLMYTLLLSLNTFTVLQEKHHDHKQNLHKNLQLRP